MKVNLKVEEQFVVLFFMINLIMRYLIYTFTLVFTTLASAQIVHVDLEPNYFVESVTPTTLINSGDEMRIDLDENGVDDYSFRLDYFGDFNSSWWCHIDTDGTNEMASFYPLNGQSPFPIPFPDTTIVAINTLIDSNADWADLSLNVNGVLGMRQNTINVNQPHILNNGDYFIGLRFDIDGNKHYGWMKLNATIDQLAMTVTVKEYAYESTPETPIITGDTGTFVNSIFELNSTRNNIKVYPNPSSDFIHINKQINLHYNSITIYDIHGANVFEISSSDKIINISSLVQGKYFLHLENDGEFAGSAMFVVVKE